MDRKRLTYWIAVAAMAMLFVLPAGAALAAGPSTASSDSLSRKHYGPAHSSLADTWRFMIVGPLVQVTYDPEYDYEPAMVQAVDGRMWVLWVHNGQIWSKSSTDDGTTWSAGAQVTNDPGGAYAPAIAQAADGKLWVVWHSSRSGNADLWASYSADNGVTWSADMQLTADQGNDYDPTIAQAADGTLWVVWLSDRSGNYDLWIKHSADGGVTWSADVQLTSDPGNDYEPAVAQAADGALWVVWNRDGQLLSKTSSDGGATWGAETAVSTGCCYSGPALAAASDGVLWLLSNRDNDIWYQTSADDGATWTAPMPYSHFVEGDASPAVAALSAGRVGIAWQSNRSGNYDIWFGIPGEREDISPPPYVDNLSHDPVPNPDNDDTITFRARSRDESGLASVELIWTLGGVAQPNLPMFDDGTHGDGEADDGLFGVQQAPLPADSQVTYQVQATDLDGNTVTSYSQSFQVIAAFVQMTDLLFVPDYGSSDTTWFRPFYTQALDALGYDYDVWDIGLRGEPPGAVLNQYVEGAVIWAVPYWGYATSTGSASVANLQAYLDNGGKLFLSGQNIAEYLVGSSFLADYLHAAFVQTDTGLYGLAGAAGDPIGDGLALNISGGDGASNQYSKDEIDPLAPAAVVLTYQLGSSQALAEPVKPVEPQPSQPGEADPARRQTVRLPEAARPGAQTDETSQAETEPSGAISSGAAGLRVDTAGYKLVYFAFGFEAIDNAASRVLTMERTLAWLNGGLARPIQIAPADGQVRGVGAVSFQWASVMGATGYEVQIDTVATFTSPNLIQETVTGVSTSHNFSTFGKRYWRVRAMPDGVWTIPWRFVIAGPLVQVTTDPGQDYYPAMAQAVDGTLWVMWYRNGQIWSKTSSDDGVTWSAGMQLTNDPSGAYAPAITQAADGKLWVVWHSSRSGNADLWASYSADNGVTWSVDMQLTNNSSHNYNPAIARAADGKLWVVWMSDRSGNYDLWIKHSADGGVTWSADEQLTSDPGNDYEPAVAQAADGALWVVWNRNGQLLSKTSSDGGATWGAEAVLNSGCCYGHPALAAASDGVLWLVSNRDRDLWYQTSMDDGATWTVPVSFSRFIEDDASPAVAALSAGRVGIAWQSTRSGNWDIWFGIPGEREDISPPPYVEGPSHDPAPNPDSDDTITFRAWARDESGLASVELIWTLDGVAQPDLPMFDDGAHGDGEAGDGLFGVQQAPLPAGSQVTYQVRATDVDGNTYTSYNQSLQVIAAFVNTADLLFVPDYGSNDTSWFRPYYTEALDTLGYDYDIWDTYLRGELPGAVLNQYVGGAVIWAVPYSGYATNQSSASVANLQTYLDNGGKLFLTGQNIAQALAGSSFLTDYLHATFVQGETGLYGLAGAAGDPIGDGVALNISGGDGAGNQYSKDEIDPLAPAAVVLTYQAGASNVLAEPVKPVEPQGMAGPQPGRADPAGLQPASPAEVERREAQGGASSGLEVEPSGSISSGAAGLRVDTGAYKVVYFAFGFEGINSAAHRALTMERTLAWLDGVLARPIQIAPANGQVRGVGAVTFQWASVVGSSGYEIQIDTVATFNSPNLIQETVTGVSTSHSFSTLGNRYWRVRALPGGAWTNAWRFLIAGPLVQVTTNPDYDYYPALFQAANGTLWVMWHRNGQIWSKSSSDDGTTWSADVQVTNDPGGAYAPTIAQAADGKLWMVWYSYRAGNADLWAMASADSGATWSAELQLTADPGNDYDPTIAQAADGKLWVVWLSDRSGNYDLWVKHSVDGGVTWSADVQLTNDPGGAYEPAVVQAADGTLWVVWNRNGQLLAKTSSDGGATWGSETVVNTGCCYSGPALAAASDGVLWLLSNRDNDIWYQTSADDGATWTASMPFSHFVENDGSPAVAVLSAGRVGIAWQSNRSGNYDIWFGIPGEREDISPPPYVDSLSYEPAPNPDSDDTITFRAWARDESGLTSVELIWTLDGVAQPDLAMFDDGAHGDGGAGDRLFGVQQAPLPAGSQVTYQVRATDLDGNIVTSTGQPFRVIAAFVQMTDLLFVPDSGGDTAWFRSFYTQTLDALDYDYDIWDTGLRGELPGTVLDQYTEGAVIWAAPHWGYVNNQGGASVAALQAYLDNGGKLFLTGQNIAEALAGSTFLADYLHAIFVQGDTGLYGLAGAAGDPIGDGLALNISGDGGANDQYSKDEIDPLAPAAVVLTYQAGAINALAEPVKPQSQPPQPGEADPARRQIIPTPGAARPSAQTDETSQAETEPSGAISSGAAGLRVDTAGYKVVYFAFGFEGINSAADRATVMGRVLSWLGIAPSAVQATVSFNPGWNLVALELDPITPYTAQSWLDEINAQGGNCSEIDRWLNGSWDAHINGLPFNNFSVELGKGYFVRCSGGSTWTFLGRRLSGGVALTLQPGWNLVGIPYPQSGYTAQSLLDDIASQGGACSEIDRWLYGAWDAHLGGLPFNNFAIAPDAGYFLKCSLALTFIPSLQEVSREP